MNSPSTLACYRSGCASLARVFRQCQERGMSSFGISWCGAESFQMDLLKAVRCHSLVQLFIHSCICHSSSALLTMCSCGSWRALSWSQYVRGRNAEIEPWQSISRMPLALPDANLRLWRKVHSIFTGLSSSNNGPVNFMWMLMGFLFHVYRYNNL